MLKIKLFENDDGKKWSSNVVDRNFEILCVSQFTLYYHLKGNKLDFHRAMSANLSEPFYNKFLQKLGALYNHELIKGDFLKYCCLITEIINRLFSRIILKYFKICGGRYSYALELYIDNFWMIISKYKFFQMVNLEL